MDRVIRDNKEREVSERSSDILATLNERQRRLWAGAEARQIGRGGINIVADATGMSRTTVAKGVRELENGESPGEGRIRKSGGGRKTLTENQPELEATLLKLVEPTSRGEPESPLRWTVLSTKNIAKELRKRKFQITDRSVAKILKKHKFSLQGNDKSQEGQSHPDRNAQFEHIHRRMKWRMSRRLPVISVDTKKKENIGNFANKGKEWRPKDAPRKVKSHDFPDKKLGKAIPYGVYDVGENHGFVNVGIDHDTAEFAVHSIRWWWKHIGAKRYRGAGSLYILADSGGSNGNANRLWKRELQTLADETGLTIQVSHYPAGTSKWNKVEHFLFNHIAMNWRGRPLVDMQTVIKLISSTTSENGLKVQCRTDRKKYPTKIKVTPNEMKLLRIIGEIFHPDWNYTIKPR